MMLDNNMQVHYTTFYVILLLYHMCSIICCFIVNAILLFIIRKLPIEILIFWYSLTGYYRHTVIMIISSLIFYSLIILHNLFMINIINYTQRMTWTEIPRLRKQIALRKTVTNRNTESFFFLKETYYSKWKFGPKLAQ